MLILVNHYFSHLDAFLAKTAVENPTSCEVLCFSFNEEEYSQLEPGGSSVRKFWELFQHCLKQHGAYLAEAGWVLILDAALHFEPTELYELCTLLAPTFEIGSFRSALDESRIPNTLFFGHQGMAKLRSFANSSKIETDFYTHLRKLEGFGFIDNNNAEVMGYREWMMTDHLGTHAISFNDLRAGLIGELIK